MHRDQHHHGPPPRTYLRLLGMLRGHPIEVYQDVCEGHLLHIPLLHHARSVLALHMTGDGTDVGRKVLLLWRQGFGLALDLARGIAWAWSRAWGWARSRGHADGGIGGTAAMERGQEHQRRAE